MALLDALLLDIQGAEELVVVVESLDHSAAKASGELSFALHIVALENLPGRVHDALRVVPVVGQDKEAFGVPVEPSDSEEASEPSWNQIEHKAFRVFVL